MKNWRNSVKIIWDIFNFILDFYLKTTRITSASSPASSYTSSRSFCKISNNNYHHMQHQKYHIQIPKIHFHKFIIIVKQHTVNSHSLNISSTYRSSSGRVRVTFESDDATEMTELGVPDRDDSTGAESTGAGAGADFFPLPLPFTETAAGVDRRAGDGAASADVPGWGSLPRLRLARGSPSCK